ncbi:energy-coupling factor transporter transmembrane component T [Paenibacillus sp. YPG26]|uniref:energy-coupling factor transporter transmembrane component T family protein n=1 Tax=Paenibacillus sp. YPG26 TaxID=2878915 RepID=UPI00203FBE11|nr:energy-coupling factor transporter transmembrane component T [Paenibacillus sp. YPG26]USB33809.1 energy-coupling factor transporter transmembrane protein EcfT [Paenibacillus sp. YPG26]
MSGRTTKLKGRFVLQGFDPLSKLVALICLAALAMHWENPLPLALMLVFLAGAACFGAGMTLGALRQRMAFIGGFSLPLFLLTTLAAPGGRVLGSIGPLELTTGGLYDGGAAALRMCCLFLSSLVYIASTDPGDFVIMVVQKLKIPYRLAFGVSIALTFLPLLEQEGRAAAAAREIRGGRPVRGVRGRVQRIKSHVAAMFTAAIRRIQQTAGAMESKGFGAYPGRTFLREVPLQMKGLLMMLASVIVTACMWVL